MYNLVDYAMIQIIPFTATTIHPPQQIKWHARGYALQGEWILGMIIRAITTPPVMIWCVCGCVCETGQDYAHFCYHQPLSGIGLDWIGQDGMISNPLGIATEYFACEYLI